MAFSWSRSGNLVSPWSSLASPAAPAEVVAGAALDAAVPAVMVRAGLRGYLDFMPSAQTARGSGASEVGDSVRWGQPSLSSAVTVAAGAVPALGSAVPGAAASPGIRCFFKMAWCMTNMAFACVEASDSAGRGGEASALGDEERLSSLVTGAWPSLGSGGAVGVAVSGAMVEAVAVAVGWATVSASLS